MKLSNSNVKQVPLSSATGMDAMFDRLGHVICDQCAGPMKVDAVKTLTDVFQVRFVCAQCEMERLVELRRESRRLSRTTTAGPKRP
jgi:hypothetical protein